MTVPLFPLRTVLFPGGPLPLRVFEARYLDMISECLKAEQPFGVLLIREGSETGSATTYDIGTLARIADWYHGSDGILGITTIGEQRFRLLSTSTSEDGLYVGEIERLQPDPVVALPERRRALARILDGVLDDLGRLYEGIARQYDDAGWVAYRFAEILPISVEEKQRCLETDDPLQRLELVADVLNTVRNVYTRA